jgi:hypothetical protein
MGQVRHDADDDGCGGLAVPADRPSGLGHPASGKKTGAMAPVFVVGVWHG